MAAATMNSLRRISSSFLVNRVNSFHRFGSSAARYEHSISRDWLAQLWVEESKKLAKRERQAQVCNARSLSQVAIEEESGPMKSYKHSISRDWLAQLWVEERKKLAKREKKAQVRNAHPLSQVAIEEERGPMKSYKQQQHQPPVSQNLEGALSPKTPQEVKLAPLLARSNLVITRDVEWANIMFSIEQESRYVIVDACYPESPVGFIHEQSNLIFRQLLRSRRPFTAQIIDATGNEIFRIRRPFWIINSSIYAEVDGKEIGVVHRRWHLWRRIYDLYLGNKQFAVVENPGFWNWSFTLKDENDNVLAQIDRNWRGVGFELFTDAGMYAIRFGDADSSLKPGLASAIEELEIVRPLTLAERAVAVALAVSLDSDYFSRRGGWGLPFLVATE